MEIHVKLFAGLAERAGTPSIRLELDPGATVGSALSTLRHKYPALDWPTGTMTAVNMAYVSPNAPLHDTDELALIPPVSGG